MVWMRIVAPSPRRARRTQPDCTTELPGRNRIVTIHFVQDQTKELSLCMTPPHSLPLRILVAAHTFETRRGYRDHGRCAGHEAETSGTRAEAIIGARAPRFRA